MNEPTLQNVPEDGVYVTWYYDYVRMIASVHKTLTAAVSESTGYSRAVGFVRWNSGEIEDIKATQPQQSEPAKTVTLTWQHLRTLLESARAGDSIDDAMLQAEEWNITEGTDDEASH